MDVDDDGYDIYAIVELKFYNLQEGINEDAYNSLALSNNCIYLYTHFTQVKALALDLNNNRTVSSLTS